MKFKREQSSSKSKKTRSLKTKKNSKFKVSKKPRRVKLQTPVTTQATVPQSTSISKAEIQSPSKKTNMSSENAAIAISNNDIAYVSWKYKEKIKDCLGFAIYRIDINAQTTMPLPAWVGFQGGSNDDWKPSTTEKWPIQKFNWGDFTANPGGFYQYKIVPMVGTPDNLQPLNAQALTSNPVQLGPNRGLFSTYFNRGILSTQSLAHQIPEGSSGSPDYKVLTNRIDQPGDPLRQSLGGNSITGLSLLLERAKKQGGQCYGALYELTDTELEKELIGSSFVHLVLSNANSTEKQNGKTVTIIDGENASTRQALHESNVDVTDRILPNGHIGHNKSMVYVDAGGKPQAVLTGSTNWTPTGLCAQSNNALIIESPTVAAIYFDYWNRLKKDTQDGVNKPQTPSFRSDNDEPHKAILEDGKTDMTIWFSPNTKSYDKTPNSPTPSDMQEVFDVMSSAKQAILFLAFQPGTPSIVTKTAECQNNNENLYVRGAVTDPKAVQEFNTLLFHRSGDKPDATIDDVVDTTAITDQFSYWHKELLKSSPGAHAIIHDKIVVVDPFSPNCAVITGSHNLGYRASYNNDENMVIIRGNQALAEAYAAHILDVYEHYRWRFTLKNSGKNSWTGLQTSDIWQDRYFAPGDESQKDFRFWFGSSNT